MKTNLKIIALGAAAIWFTGCVHAHKVEGPAISEDAPNGVQVAIGSKEVNTGDTVYILKKSCRTISFFTKGDPSSRTSCYKERVGQATVLKVLSADSAIINAPEGLQMDSDILVEKLEK